MKTLTLKVFLTLFQKMFKYFFDHNEYKVHSMNKYTTALYYVSLYYKSIKTLFPFYKKENTS
ncbi:hypothetical protein A33I_07455 [Alkalihalophilus marmarensis DSM 21297]|uniref:Uncharacterized protein n=1 Tax=Alkalihalophilus marmarensis DSM 21297 TaxID=1188261 RepID=U6STM6_9BACI|nr:hypothetical protein A33I_07455 [Alkalihalophilus marmarensis DSM 21297]